MRRLFSSVFLFLLLCHPSFAVEPFNQFGKQASRNCCDTGCCDGTRFWGRVEYLLWWTKGTDLPPLITSSPAGTPQNEAGVLGLPNTTILYGDGYVNDDPRSGVRISGGIWLDDCQMIGIGADYIDLGTGDDHGEASGNGSPIISRPFYNVQTGEQAAELVSYPGVLSGTVTADSSDYFQSAGSWAQLNLVYCPCCCDSCCDCWGYSIDLLAGYRYYRLDDQLTITEDLLDISGGSTDGTTYLITDSFRAENRFHGGEIGMQTRIQRNCWYLNVLAKMAIGNNHTVVTIDGQTVTTIPGFPETIDENGIYATQSNIGRYEDDRFTIIPQIGLELGYKIRKNIDVFAGYNLIYWPHVVRAADQVDLNIDPRNWPPVQAGALPFPAPKLCSTDYWAQGLNFGVECRY